MTEILLKVALNTIKTNKQKSKTADPNDLLANIAEEKVYLALNNNHSYSYTIQHYVIKFISNIRQISRFCMVHWYTGFLHQ